MKTDQVIEVHCKRIFYLYSYHGKLAMYLTEKRVRLCNITDYGNMDYKKEQIACQLKVIPLDE